MQGGGGIKMIVLVRCHDNTYAPALESHLDELVSNSLIAAFLRNGTWIEVAGDREEEYELLSPKSPLPRITGMAACF